MKWTFVQWLLLALSAGLSWANPGLAQEVLSRRITLPAENQTVLTLLHSLETQSGVRFMYRHKLIDTDRQISLPVTDESLGNVLIKLLKPLDLHYELLGKRVLITRLPTANAATPNPIPESLLNPLPPSRVSGRVLDKDNGTGLPGVNVSVKGTATGTITDANGDYSVTAPDEKATLVFSFIGYLTQEVIVSNRTSINITLVPDTKSLNEVVVVAYGTQRRADVTGAVATVSASEIKDIPVTQFAQKLQGKTPGVQILQTTGVPGAGMSIRIRGAASISGSSQPLYVVDRFPIVGDISNINPDEIETFSILKDASATALYGSRASNGVVLITTKRAANGRSSISFNANYGVQQVPQRGRPDMMNAQEFAQYENEVFQEKIRLGQATSIPAEYQNPAQYAGKGTDWYGLLLRDAPMQNYSLSLTSSKDKLSSAATVGYLSQDGVLLNSNYKRYSLRLNSDYKVNDRVTIGVNLAPTYSTNDSPNTDGDIFDGGIIQNAIATSPIAPAVNPDGTLPLTATSTGLFPNPNWYNVVQIVKNNTRTGRILSNAYGTLEIIKGLNFKSSINIDYTNLQYNNFTPSTSGNLFSAPPIQTNATQRNNIFYSWLTENTLTYSRAFGHHHLDALAGYTAQKFRQDFSNISASGFANDKVKTLNAGTQFSPSFDLQEWSLVSFVSRLNYNYKGKYLLSASFRRDGSSRFAPNTKYGNFPAVSVGWNVSDEAFMAQIPVISMLKLRAGYGLNGNFNIGNYGYLARTTATNYPFNNALLNGTTIANIGNNNLSWEKSNQLDIGMDIGLLKGRIFLTYDYFYKTTSDMLLNVGVPRQSGFATITDNVGKFEFWGHEFAISTQNLVGKLKWSTDFNMTFIKNNVLNLGPYDPALPRGDANGPNIIQIGSPIGSFFGYKFLGVYKNQADFDASPKYLGGDGPSMVGTVKYADLNGDGVITVADKTIIGNPNPKFMFGMTNNLSYGNFDFSTVIAGQYGNDIQNRTLGYIQNLDGVFNVTKDVGRRWKSEQDPGDGIHPRAVVSTPLARTTNSRWVTDGSYLTIKNITLGYTIPLPKNSYLRSVRAFSSMQQAFVFTSYKGANPEVNANGTNALVQGIDATSYPVPRTISFGVNVNLK